MMNRDVMGRQMFANGGPAMPQPEMGMDQMAMMAQEQGVDPAQLQGALEMAQGQMQQIDNAENYEQVINGIRGDQQPLEARYAELTSVVGQEDSQATPESVLTLLQPVMQMAAVDQGIGGLAAEEMTAPIEGPMAEGIMSTVGMGEPDPVNFSQGGPVIHMAEGGEPKSYENRLKDIYQAKSNVMANILGTEDREAALADQRRMTQAQMLFDIAQGGLALASPTERSMSFGERLATSFNPVFGNIGARAGELEKFKQGQAAEQRALDLQAFNMASGELAAQEARAFTARENSLTRQNALNIANAKKKAEAIKLLAERKLEERGTIELIDGSRVSLVDIKASQKDYIFTNPEILARAVSGDSSLGFENFKAMFVAEALRQAQDVEIDTETGQSRPKNPLSGQHILALSVLSPSTLEEIQNKYDSDIVIPKKETAIKTLLQSSPITIEAIKKAYGGNIDLDAIRDVKPQEVKRGTRLKNIPIPPLDVYSKEYKAKQDNFIDPDGNVPDIREVLPDLVVKKNGKRQFDFNNPSLYSSRELGPQLDGLYPDEAGGTSIVNLSKFKGQIENLFSNISTLGLSGKPGISKSARIGMLEQAKSQMRITANDVLVSIMGNAPEGSRLIAPVQKQLKEESDLLKPNRPFVSDQQYVAALDRTLDKLSQVYVNASSKIPGYAGYDPKNVTTKKDVQEARNTVPLVANALSDLAIIRETFAMIDDSLPSLRTTKIGETRTSVVGNIKSAQGFTEQPPVFTGEQIDYINRSGSPQGMASGFSTGFSTSFTNRDKQ
jgi:hypothetical protein